MAFINCMEAGCPALLPDPCGPTTILFTEKFNLQNSSGGGSKRMLDRIIKIDGMIKNKLGLLDAEVHYQNFVRSNEGRTATASLKIFTLRCAKGHVNQYSVNCP
ncbi:hypothetical protein [Pedobacter sp. R-06]|uniref:hypothetical protein n=1 Tax=Pedobacter sp. R-06 TaxID=3404051 RepID=UPI003CF156F8